MERAKRNSQLLNIRASMSEVEMSEKIYDLEQQLKIANDKITKLESAFNEVCLDIRNHAPNYVHPLEAELGESDD